MKKLLIFFLFLIAAAAVSAVDPLIWTDKDDYNPGETVLFGGLHFLPNTNIDIGIEAPDGKQEYITTMSDASGGFTDVAWIVNGDMAMEGDYYACAWDGVTEACTQFTDCETCHLIINQNPECVDDGSGFTIKFNATYNTFACQKKLKIVVKDGTNTICTAENSDLGASVECISDACYADSPTVYIYYWQAWFWCFGEWKLLGSETVSGELDCCDACLTDEDCDPNEVCVGAPLQGDGITGAGIADTTGFCQLISEEVPEFSITSAIALVALLLAGYAIINGTRHKKK